MRNCFCASRRQARDRRDSRAPSRRARPCSCCWKNCGRASSTSCSAGAALLLLAALPRETTGRASPASPRQPLDGLGEGQALRLHHEVEDVAVLARREVEPSHLLVIDEERRRLLGVEGRQPLPLAPRLLQLHAPAHDLRNRKPRLDLFEKGRGESHEAFGRSLTLLIIGSAARRNKRETLVPAIHRPGRRFPTPINLRPRNPAAPSPSRSPWRNPSGPCTCAFSAPMTLPMSFMEAAPVSAMAASMAAVISVVRHLLGQELVDDGDFLALLLLELGTSGLAVDVGQFLALTSPSSGAGRGCRRRSRSCPRRAPRCPCPSARPGSCARSRGGACRRPSWRPSSWS